MTRREWLAACAGGVPLLVYNDNAARLLGLPS
jgi:hypothetical protein